MDFAVTAREDLLRQNLRRRASLSRGGHHKDVTLEGADLELCPLSFGFTQKMTGQSRPNLSLDGRGFR